MDCSSVRPHWERSRNCFGREGVESGQNRCPWPPAIMTATNSVSCMKKYPPKQVLESGPSPLLPEPPLPRLKRPNGPQEVDLAEFGPVGVAEVELAVGSLPQ